MINPLSVWCLLTVLIISACPLSAGKHVTAGTETRKCLTDEYFDPNLPRCEPCGPTCVRQHVEEVPSACIDVCRGWKSPVVSEQTPFLGTGGEMEFGAGKIAVICLMATLIGACLIALPVLLVKKQNCCKKKQETLRFPIPETLLEQEDSCLHGNGAA